MHVMHVMHVIHIIRTSTVLEHKKGLCVIKYGRYTLLNK